MMARRIESVSDGDTSVSRTVAGAERSYVVLLGTSEETRGGIAAVISAYRAAGLFERWPIVHIPTHVDGRAFRKLSVAVRAWFRYMSLVRRRKVALIHVHAASNGSFWRKLCFIVPAVMLRIPFIFHLHGGGFIDFYDKRLGAVRRALIRFVLRRASLIIVLSNEWRRRIGHLTANRNVLVIPNPVSSELLEVTPSVGKSNAILFVGRLVQEKGIMELVQAFSRLRTQLPDWRLLFAGEGEVSNIVASAQALGVADGIEFLGWISGKAKTAALLKADIYVLPSWLEGLPMGVLEAMAAGLPVVATRVGGVPDAVVDGVTGILVEPKDVEALAAALMTLGNSPDLRKRMGTQGRQHISERFLSHQVISQIESAYKTLGAMPISRALSSPSIVGH